MSYRIKGKTLYKCEDCGKRKFLRGIELNSRSGNRCMNCGGRLEADSANAINTQRIKADNRNRPDLGSILKLKWRPPDQLSE